MSPLALLYVLFASSPLLNNWHHESTFPSTWNAMPFEHESFEHYTPSIWGEESTYEPEHLNWLLRKAVRSTEERYPTSIRSIISEMTGRRFFNEEPRMFENVESVRPIVHLIKRIAEVNPILIEKILSCPITLRKVEKVLRNVEPETLRMVEKMIKKSLPVNIREKVVRNVLKALLVKSSVFARRSIVSEMYPTEESLFSTRRHFSEESMIKNLIEKLFATRRSEFPEVVLAKIIRKLIRENREVSPVEELFSTRRHYSESKMVKNLIEKLFSTRFHAEEPMNKVVLAKIARKLFSTRRHFNVESFDVESVLRRAVEKMSRRSILSEMYPTESLFGEHSYEPEHFEVLSKVLRRVVKSVVKTHEHKSIKNLIKKALRHAEVTPFVATRNVEELCFTCESVCESSSLIMSPIKSINKICRVCEKVCPMTSTFAGKYEQPIFGRWNKLSKLF